ncbi:MAG: HAMP domain-containing histidine kinase [Flavobacteriales bacterium]|nr:HAMP domain-containing histidine kinase [Flavobacteriales bacterium]
MALNNYQFRTIIKAAIFVLAMTIVGVSLLYTDNLAQKLADEERVKMALWAEATKLIATASQNEDYDLTYALSVVKANNTIPVIVTLESGEIINEKNIDSVRSKDPEYLKSLIKDMRSENEPIEAELFENQKIIIYYNNSILFQKLKLYPYVQLAIIAVFLMITYYAFSYNRRWEQDQVWVGMSKETAHQLGTPISSLMAWMELTKANDGNMSEEVIQEVEYDIKRLELITERFSKIGSEPVLKNNDLVEVVTESVEYLQKRLSSHIEFEISSENNHEMCKINVPLFAWVLENLSKNAADAMEGTGKLTFHISSTDKQIILDVSDTGKGINPSKFKTVFEPGYTTKKRGWGLGLSLVKRIIKNYHDGQIFVKESTPNVKTTFRIILKK